MLTLDIEDFMVQLKEGSIENVGAPAKSASVTLYDVESAEVREFGDKRVKLTFEDGEGNDVEVALFPEDARALANSLERLQAESEVFE